MKWSEPKPPSEKCRYDNVTCETPLGEMSIEWKSWKDYDNYTIMLDGMYIGEGDDLDDAKKKSKYFLIERYDSLKLFLEL